MDPVSFVMIMELMLFLTAGALWVLHHLTDKRMKEHERKLREVLAIKEEYTEAIKRLHATDGVVEKMDTLMADVEKMKGQVIGLQARAMTGGKK